jgi:hypothetical protein
MPTLPVSTTPNLGLGQWNHGDHPGHVALNNNWSKIDVLANGVIYPEQYGAIGDGTTDDTTAISNALTAAKGKTIVFTKAVYKCASKIVIDLDGADIQLISNYGSKLYLTNTTSTHVYQTSEGNFHLHNAGNVIVSGITFEGIRQIGETYITPLLAQGDGNSSLCNVVIEDAENVLIDNCTFTKAVYAGIRCNDLDRITIINSNIDYNTYAGAFIYHAKQVIAEGNSFSYNGTTTFAYGYGISLSHRYGQEIDCEAVLIQGNRCFYNTRKGIDLHGGIGAKIIGNHIKGFATAGIGAVNEAGSDPDNPSVIDAAWAKRVSDLFIAYNLIENDLTWLATLTNDYVNHIQVGSYADTDLGAGAIKIIGNILRNCNASNQRGPIYVFVNTDGTPIDEITIKDNSIYDAEVTATTFGDFSTQDGVITVVEGTIVPLFVDISNNKIYGDSANGIKVYPQNPDFAQSNSVNVSNNQLIGTFTNPVFIDRDLRQTALNNTYNGELLPDMIDAFNGSLKAKLLTAASTGTKDLLSQDGNNFLDGVCVYEVNIIAAGASPKFQALYKLSAYAKNDSETPVFGASFLEETWLLGTRNISYRPSLSWVGSGDTRTLRVSCPTTYTNYFIEIKFSSWRNQHWRVS